MFWDQPPQKHCAAVYLKHLGGSTFKSYLRYNPLQCTNLWILKILKLIFSASKGIKNREFFWLTPTWRSTLFLRGNAKIFRFNSWPVVQQKLPSSWSCQCGTKNTSHTSQEFGTDLLIEICTLKKSWKKMFTTWNRWGCLVQDLKRIPISMPWFSSFMVPFWTGKPTATQGMPNGAKTNSHCHYKNLRVPTHNHTKGGQQSSIFVRCSSPDTKDTVSLGAAISVPKRCWPKCSNSQVFFGQACLLRQPIIITNKKDFKIFMMWSSARSSCMFLSQYQILG